MASSASKRAKLRAKRTKLPFDWSFLVSGGLVVVMSAGLLTLLWPQLRQVAHNQANRLVNDGRRLGGQEALLDYQLARLLDAGNPAAALEVAKLEAQAGRYTQAVHTLAVAGQGTEASRLRLRLHIELASAELAGSAGQLAAQATTDDDRLLAAIGYLVAGQPQAAAPFAARLTSPRAVQRLNRAKASVTALGAELYATGLVRASQRVLVKQPSSLQRNLLLGHLAATKHTAAANAQARGYFSSALQYDITNQEARAGLIAALEALGDSQAAIQQVRLLDRLQTGRP